MFSSQAFKNSGVFERQTTRFTKQSSIGASVSDGGTLLGEGASGRSVLAGERFVFKEMNIVDIQVSADGLIEMKEVNDLGHRFYHPRERAGSKHGRLAGKGKGGDQSRITGLDMLDSQSGESRILENRNLEMVSAGQDLKMRDRAQNLESVSQTIDPESESDITASNIESQAKTNTFPDQFIFHKINFSSFKNLKRLSLSGNSLFHIPKIILEQGPNLEYLILADNFIQIVPKEIGNLKKLKHLDVSRNLVHRISKQVVDLEMLSSLSTDWEVFGEQGDFFTSFSRFVFKNFLYNRVEFVDFCDYAAWVFRNCEEGASTNLRLSTTKKDYMQILDRVLEEGIFGGVLGFAVYKFEIIKGWAIFGIWPYHKLALDIWHVSFQKRCES